MMRHQPRLTAATLSALCVLGTFLTSPVLLSAEVCEFCNVVVVVNPSRADCFLIIFEERMDRLNQAGLGFVEVDFESCAGGRTDRSKDPNAPIPGGDASDSVVYLGPGEMVCLHSIITRLGVDGFVPERVVNFSSDCPSVMSP